MIHNYYNRAVYLMVFIFAICSIANSQESEKSYLQKQKEFLQSKSREELYNLYKAVGGNRIAGMEECARAYRGAKMNKEALEVYNEILGDPKLTESYRQVVRAELASFYHKLKDYQKSLALCDEIIKNPAPSEYSKFKAFWRKVRCLIELKKYKEAIDTIGQWNEMIKNSKYSERLYKFGTPMPDGMEFHAKVQLAIIHQEQGKYAEAIKERREILDWVAQIDWEAKQVHPMQRKAYESMCNITYPIAIGDCYKELEEYGLALAQYKKALENLKKEQTERPSIHGEKKIKELEELVSVCKEKIE